MPLYSPLSRLPVGQYVQVLGQVFLPALGQVLASFGQVLASLGQTLASLSQVFAQGLSHGAFSADSQPIRATNIKGTSTNVIILAIAEPPFQSGFRAGNSHAAVPGMLVSVERDSHVKSRDQWAALCAPGLHRSD